MGLEGQRSPELRKKKIRLADVLYLVVEKSVGQVGLVYKGATYRPNQPPYMMESRYCAWSGEGLGSAMVSVVELA